MGKPVTYPDSGGSYTRTTGGKLEQVHATQQLAPVPEQKDAAVSPDAQAAPAGDGAKLKEGK